MICESCKSPVLIDTEDMQRGLLFLVCVAIILSIFCYINIHPDRAELRDFSDMDVQMREYSISIVRDVVREEMRKIARTEEESRFNEVILSEETIRRIVQDELFVMADD